MKQIFSPFILGIVVLIAATSVLGYEMFNSDIGGGASVQAAMVLFLVGMSITCYAFWDSARSLTGYRSLVSDLTDDKKSLLLEVSQAKDLAKSAENDLQDLRNDFSKSKSQMDVLLSQKEELEKRFTAQLEELKNTQKILDQWKSHREQETSGDAVAFLTILQERGRLIDFLMEDISAYSDQQVGAAARVVHQGCQKVLAECFSLAPMTHCREGSRISLGSLQKELREYEGTEGDAAGSMSGVYRLIGRVPDVAPNHLEGTLVHRGWLSTQLNLPKMPHSYTHMNKQHHVIVPPEVEL